MSEFYDIGKEKKVSKDGRIALLELAESLVLVVMSVFIFRTLLFAPFSVTGYGMASTLIPGDNLLTARIIYGIPLPFTEKHIVRFKHVKQNEVVVYRDIFENNEYSIRRCVAVGGQNVLISNKKLMVDNEEFEFPETYEKGNELIVIDKRFSPRDNLESFRVPKKGDTVVFDSLKIFEIDYMSSLIRQENPDKRLSHTADLIVNGKYANDLTFDDYKSDLRKNDGTLNFDAMNWIDLTNVLNFLSAKDDSLACSFRRSIYLDGQEVKNYVVKTRPVFLMGDNWDESMDSRYRGYVSENSIVSMALFIYWSKDGSDFRFKRLFLLI